MNEEQFKAKLIALENLPKATEKQVEYINDLVQSRVMPDEMSILMSAIENDFSKLPKKIASKLIDKLSSCKKRVFLKYPDGTLVEVK